MKATLELIARARSSTAPPAALSVLPTSPFAATSPVAAATSSDHTDHVPARADAALADMDFPPLPPFLVDLFRDGPPSSRVASSLVSGMVVTPMEVDEADGDDAQGNVETKAAKRGADANAARKAGTAGKVRVVAPSVAAYSTKYFESLLLESSYLLLAICYSPRSRIGTDY